MPINFDQADIVAYATLEPRIVARTLTPVIKAQVHDALWMLTQQWRVGEFKGDDAGTLVKARIETQSTMLNRFQSRKGPVTPFDLNVPLEAKVERLPLIFDLGMQLTVGYQWMKILQTSTTLSAYVLLFKEAFPLDDITSDNPQQASNGAAVSARRAASGNVINGASFVSYLKTANAKDLPGVSFADGPAMDAAQARFLGWFNNTYYQPTSDADVSWSDTELEYQFSVSAPVNPGSNASQIVLRADKYKDGNVDWYSFDKDPATGAALTEIPQGSISNIFMPRPNPMNPSEIDVIQSPEVKTYIPHTIEFKGMPKGRWWEFEDNNIDVAKMLTQKQDISKLVVMEFGLIYSNDWFIIPHTIPDTSLNNVNGLVVTDVFGQQFRVDRAGSGSNQSWQRWDMYNVSDRGVQTMQSSGRPLLMVPNLGNRIESEPLEKVLLLRDEMANMVWGVEETVPDELMSGMDGKNAANELQKYLAENYAAAVPSTYIPNAAEHRFRLSNAVPENWIPFITARQAPGADRSMLLQRATLLRYVNDEYTNETIRPRTHILSKGLEQVLHYTFGDGQVHEWVPYGSSAISVDTIQKRLQVAVSGIWSGTMISFQVVPGRKYNLRYNLQKGTYTNSLAATLLYTVGWIPVAQQIIIEDTDSITVPFTPTAAQMSLVIETTSAPPPSAFYIDEFTLEIAEPYFINEEEAGRSGSVISTNFQRTRWYDGTTFTWLGRKVQSGRGEGNSGLKFDILLDKEKDDNAIDIPFAGMSGWWRADASNNQVSNGRVTSLKDLSGNGLNLTPWGSSAGPVMTTFNNMPALSFTNNILANATGNQPLYGYDDFTIFYVGNSIIGRGADDVPGSLWSISMEAQGISIVLVNAGDTAYTVSTGFANNISIAAATLEQRDPAYFPFAARLTLYNKDGLEFPVANNPNVISNNNFLRNTASPGMIMGAAGTTSQFVNGYTFETIIYRRKLNDTEMRKVLSYLKNKYPFA